MTTILDGQAVRWGSEWLGLRMSQTPRRVASLLSAGDEHAISVVTDLLETSGAPRGGGVGWGLVGWWWVGRGLVGGW